MEFNTVMYDGFSLCSSPCTPNDDKQFQNVRLRSNTINGLSDAPCYGFFTCQRADNGIWLVLFQQTHISKAIHEIFDPKGKYVFDIDLATCLSACQWPHIKDLMGEEYHNVETVTEELARVEALHSPETLHLRKWTTGQALSMYVYFVLADRFKDEEMRKMHVWLDLRCSRQIIAGSGCPFAATLGHLHYNPVNKQVMANIHYVINGRKHNARISINSFEQLNQCGFSFAKETERWEGTIYQLPPEISKPRILE